MRAGRMASRVCRDQALFAGKFLHEPLGKPVGVDSGAAAQHMAGVVPVVVILPVLVDAAAGFRVERLRRMRPQSPFVYGMAAGVGFALILLVPLDSTPFIYFRF